MRRFLISLLLVSCAATADDMTDANKFLVAKEYAKALPLYIRLANAGNAAAQFRVGEMMWYGDGTAQDLQAAHRWFEKSAAAGNPDAREALAALDRRQSHGGDIGYWMNEYEGADLRSGNFECRPPSIPAVSKTNADVEATRKTIEAWQTCYNGFVANFNATAPIGKRIPAEVLDMMTPQEIDSARIHVEAVYRKTLAEAQRDADAVRTQQAGWETATERFAKEENARVTSEKTAVTRLVDESRRQRRDYDIMNRMGPPPPVTRTNNR
jgi:TPR repeat protein